MRLFFVKMPLIPLFGTNNVNLLVVVVVPKSVLSYNYVDSSYIQMLFYYGIVHIVLLVLFYVFYHQEIYKEGKVLFLALLSLITINCMIEAFLDRRLQYLHVYIIPYDLISIKGNK